MSKKVAVDADFLIKIVEQEHLRTSALMDLLSRVTATLDKTVEIVHIQHVDAERYRRLIEDESECEDEEVVRYLLKPTSEDCPGLTRQIASFPKSNMDALYDYPKEKQARILGEVEALIKKTAGPVQDNLSKYKDLVSKINERNDLDLFAAPASNFDMLILLDRPSKTVAVFMKSTDENEDVDMERVIFEMTMDIPTIAGMEKN